MEVLKLQQVIQLIKSIPIYPFLMILFSYFLTLLLLKRTYNHFPCILMIVFVLASDLFPDA